LKVEQRIRGKKVKTSKLEDHERRCQKTTAELEHSTRSQEKTAEKEVKNTAHKRQRRKPTRQKKKTTSVFFLSSFFPFELQTEKPEQASTTREHRKYQCQIQDMLT
jgi:hypothetical protein